MRGLFLITFVAVTVGCSTIQEGIKRDFTEFSNEVQRIYFK